MKNILSVIFFLVCFDALAQTDMHPGIGRAGGKTEKKSVDTIPVNRSDTLRYRGSSTRRQNGIIQDSIPQNNPQNNPQMYKNRIVPSPYFYDSVPRK